MALDDLMKCMAKGMLWGFLTLMLMVLALAMTVEPIAQAEAGDTAPEPVAPGSFDDFDSAYRAYAGWSAKIWCALLRDEQPEVRILASVVVEAREADGPAVCGDDSTKVSPIEIRQAALDEGWDDPSVVAAVYLIDCFRHAPTSACDRAKLQRRFVELDPANAFAILLPLSERKLSNADEARLSDVETALLHQAAGATHYSEYTFSAIHDTYRAFLRETQVDPSRAQAGAAIAESAAEGRSEPAHLDLAQPVIEMFAVLVARASLSIGNLSRFCTAAQAAGDSATVDDCLGVARIMASDQDSYLTSMLGRDLQYTLQNPEYRGAQREMEDPNRWRIQVHGLAQICVQARGLPGDFSRLPGPMPLSHLDQFVEDFQHRGERAANKNASAREYAAYPEAFALDPARCEGILLLDESTQEDLVDQWRAEMTQGVEAWERVFEAAAVALDQQATEG